MFSTKGRYAIRVILDLAEHSDGNYIPLKEIAERQGISKKYLEIIMRELSSSNLVEGASGKGGGYKLKRKPEEYTVREILELMEGTIAPVACLADCEYNCQRKETCKTLPMWEEFWKITEDFFSEQENQRSYGEPPITKRRDNPAKMNCPSPPWRTSRFMQIY